MTVSVDTGLKYQNEAPVLTTDATSTELLRWTPELDSASVVLLSVNGTATSGDRLASQRLYQVKRDLSGTTITAMAAEARHESGSGAWTVTLAVDGVSAVVTVAGEAGHDVTWQGLVDHKGRGRNIFPPWNEKSFVFDGINEFITAGDVLGFERTDAFTLSFWVKKPNSTGAVLIGKMNDSYVGWRVYAETGITIDLINHPTTNRLTVGTTGAVLGDGGWHHVAITYTGSSLASGVAIMIDGVAVTTVAPYNTLTLSILNAVAATIGRAMTAAAPLYYPGYLDEITTYNRALSLSEVQWIYNSGAPRDLLDVAAPSNLVLWYRGDGDVYPTATDNSASGFDGTMTNMEAGDITSDVP